MAGTSYVGHMLSPASILIPVSHADAQIHDFYPPCMGTVGTYTRSRSTYTYLPPTYRRKYLAIYKTGFFTERFRARDPETSFFWK